MKYQLTVTGVTVPLGASLTFAFTSSAPSPDYAVWGDSSANLTTPALAYYDMPATVPLVVNTPVASGNTIWAVWDVQDTNQVPIQSHVTITVSNLGAGCPSRTFCATHVPDLANSTGTYTVVAC